jgi:hypothetical protein
MKAVTLDMGPSTFLLPARDLLAVWNAVSDDPTRRYLQGVYVESLAAGGVQMTATDGHILLTVAVAQGAWIGKDVTTQGIGDYGHGFILALDTGDKALKAKTAGELWLYGDTATGIIQALDIHDIAKGGPTWENQQYARVGVVEFSRIDGTFPDYRRVMPKQEAGSDGAPACVNLSLLDHMRRAGAVFSDRRGSCPVRLTTGKAGDPILVEFKSQPRMRGVIMPMRW